MVVDSNRNRTQEGRRLTLGGQSYVAVDSIAAYCMVSRTTVRRWILEGRLPAMRLPSGHFRVSVADFKSFLVRHDLPISEELQNR